MKPKFVRILSENFPIMPSVTFHAVCIASNRRKDGTYPVKIRVTFKGASRRLPTTLIARPADLTRSLHIKSPDIQRRANELIARMQGTLADLSPFILDGWDIDRVVAHIRTRMAEATFSLDFFAWADEVLSAKIPATRRVYCAAVNSLAAFLGRRALDINDLTRRLLREWLDWLDVSPGATAAYISRLGHIYRAAQSKYNDDDRVLIPRNPFDGLPRPAVHPPDGQHNLGVELLQRIIDDNTATGRERLALDVFLLSFLLMGANFADLWAARPFDGEVWEYHRQKTAGRRADGALMRVSVPAQARKYIERLTGRGGWWLNALHGLGTSKDTCSHRVNDALHGWAVREGVPPFTFYAARKTWASIARSRAVNIEKARVDECLCHIGEFRMTDIYAERDFAAMDEANARVIAVLRWD